MNGHGTTCFSVFLEKSVYHLANDGDAGNEDFYGDRHNLNGNVNYRRRTGRFVNNRNSEIA